MPKTYHVVLVNAAGNELPDYIGLPPALVEAKRISILVEAELTLEQFQTATGETDILPYLGFWANHDEGDGHFNDYHALELMEDLAEALDQHYPAPEGHCWQPRPQAEFANDPDKMDALLAAMYTGLDSEWKICDLGYEVCSNLTRKGTVDDYFVRVAQA